MKKYILSLQLTNGEYFDIELQDRKNVTPNDSLDTIRSNVVSAEFSEVPGPTLWRLP